MSGLFQAKPIIKGELTKELYKNFYIGFFVSLLISSILTWELRGIIEKRILFIWYLMILVVIFARLFLLMWYRYTHADKNLNAIHYYLFVVGSSLTSLLWGIFGSLLMPSGLVNQLFILIILSGIIAGSVQSLNASYLANILYIMLTLIPILIWESYQIHLGHKIYIWLLVLMSVYGIFSIVVARRAYLLILNNIDLRDILKKQATHDILTGLYNRLYLEEYLKIEMRRMERNKLELAVMIVDIDHFKRFNDNYGHRVGDEVLKKVAHFLTSHVRTNDMTSRYGGDEFCIILPETSKDVAMLRAEYIKKCIKKINFIPDPNIDGKISLSFGIAVYPLHGTKIETVIEAADKALFQAKALGRERVCVAPSISIFHKL